MTSKNAKHKPGRVLVTGASSGIGADLARVFARENHDLVLVARSRDRLEALAYELEEKHGVRARVLVSDLTKPGAAAEIQRALKADNVAVDILANNAGFGLFGRFVELEAHRQLEMITVNIVAMTELCLLFAQEMIERGHGGILNVASTGAFAPGPLMAVYCATKAYVLSFSEALANELREQNITVTCLCPGATETRFAETAGTSVTKLFQTGKVMASKVVAEAGRKALARGADLIIPGFSNWATVASTRLIPLRTAANLTRAFLATPKAQQHT